MAPPIVQTVAVTKRFPGIVANQDVSLTVEEGSFHAVIGENGAGKSTLLNILYGRYKPDAGQVRINGEDVTDRLLGPSDAIRLGIGLVSQHYALIPTLTVFENVVLGSEPVKRGGIINMRAAAEHIEQLANQLGLHGFDLTARAERLSIAAQQKVEILKALYRNARILLLDEPTATLAPQEAEALFALLHTLNHQGSTIIFVSHKLREVMAHSTAVCVLRAGKNAGDFITAQTDAGELLSRMIGRRASIRQQAMFGSDALADSHSSEFEIHADPLLAVTNVSVRNSRSAIAIDKASFNLFAGEILGIAGVDGSGQRELSEAIVGLRPIEPGAGKMSLATPHGNRNGSGKRYESLVGRSVRRRREMGIGYVPEDRHRVGMILEFSIAENYLLGHETDATWGGGAMLSPRTMQARADNMIHDYDVRVGERDSRALAGELSGGNQQKVVIARVLEANPRMLVACQPTRGLDTGATEFVYNSLRRATKEGLGVLLFSLDLDEILELSDRIAVIFNGSIAGVLTREEVTAERVGALMTGGTAQVAEQSE
jgi:simple sugar transport system ATP-binding protein